MSDWNDTQRTGFGSVPRAGGDVAGVAYDQGLRKHMLSIYNYMASGVLWTGIVALMFSWGGAESPAYSLAINGGLLFWAVKLAPLAFILAMSFGLHKMSQATLQIVFWAFATVMGLSLSTIFLVYTAESIAVTFFATAGAFAGLSLWGYTTKKDISGWGSFLIMGVIGLIIAMVINIFLGSETMAFVISGIGVLIFAGLTAYDTQRLKNEYQYVRGTDFAGKAVIMGATSLYLDFVNMFMFLLQFLGSRE
ncbi:Bax inhibitor-1/YccA family protein [Erythrobacter sp. F6033]|uniref:Bax inhibitor-1/YccA family protein n=1 Tax=Erythrobacter sp. F6033 TaxID=2926401 RepID=UPI001FF11CE4|nr:Bax inhibitor-1/YccA family protein [Erythrobacter sp. F6033]MCK0129002.1 Bax inhibitor-1/YccA family protein [Erythrobacter sp. F6033]